MYGFSERDQREKMNTQENIFSGIGNVNKLIFVGAYLLRVNFSKSEGKRQGK